METKLGSIKEQVTSIKSDIVEIKDTLLDIKVTMGINTASLETHIKRTDALQDMAEDFKDHMLIVNTIFKVVVSIGALILFLDQLGVFRRLFGFID